MKPQIKKILLVDGNNYLYRIYFALYKALKKEDDYNLILHSLIYNLEKLLLNLKIDYCFFAFDFKKTTFRNDLYKDYKKDRPKMPEKLYKCMQLFETYLDKRNIHALKKENYEADDVIASLITHFYQNDNLFYILSSDIDLCQLIKKNVIFLNISKKILNPDFWTEEEFFNKFNFLPSQIIDYKSMVGDPSDNIKGVEKVGVKTAIKLLNNYTNIENIFLNANNLDKKLKDIFLLDETKDILKKNQTLIKLVDNLYLSDQEKIIFKSLKINNDLFEFLIEHKLQKILIFLKEKKNYQ
ncbi:hypothetical protein JTY60_02285 [symbiont of Argiope bruennichi]|uniref:5'-3' exonuclease n=1 Tax=symbiont of Argiope bruennichi TaxID=2810479 RepID=UPI003DA443AE